MKIYAYGKDGVLLDCGSAFELCARNLFPETAELRVAMLSEGYPKISEGTEHFRVRIGEAYRLHQKFGPWGDLMAVTVDGPFLRFDWIAPLAFPKPTLAADLIPFIRDSEGRLFWVGIKRGRPPGEGKLALIGGIRAIEKRELPLGTTHVLETPLENLMHESGEEAGIALSCIEVGDDGPHARVASVAVTIPELGIVRSRTELIHVETVSTDHNAERDPLTGQLRVHETTGYAFNLYVDRPLLAGEIEAALHPTDHSERTTPVVRQIGSFSEVEDIHNSFHAAHHRVLFFRALALCVNGITRPPAIRTH